jgi:DNA-binding Lrp family transcriptional regulator
MRDRLPSSALDKAIAAESDMDYSSVVFSVDELDLKLIHALHVDGRAPFSRIAAVLDTSDRTVARRYARLRATGRLRVVGVPDASKLRLTEWFVRLQCAPDTATRVADALARRADTSWVSLTSGGTEVTCITSTRDRNETDNLLLHKLPRTPRIISVTAHCLLRAVAGTHGWPGRTSALTAEQVELLRWQASEEDGPADLDERLLPVLAEDGRADHPTLAKATGWSESTVRRRLDQLRRTGLLYFNVDVDPLLIGYASETILWLTVEPAQLDTVADALAAHPEIAYAAATTGPSNLVAFAVCRDHGALYDFLATRLGKLPGLRHVESAPVIRRTKRSTGRGTLMHPSQAADRTGPRA